MHDVQPSVQIMAPFPRTRVGTTMRAFAKCCVDYAGPLTTKITHSACLRYLMHDVQPSVQIMAPFPRTRVGTTMRAFAKCCVDYAGPFTTKVTRRVSAKRYL